MSYQLIGGKEKQILSKRGFIQTSTEDGHEYCHECSCLWNTFSILKYIKDVGHLQYIEIYIKDVPQTTTVCTPSLLLSIRLSGLLSNGHT